MADPKGEKAATVVDGVDVHAKKTTNVAIEDLSVSLDVRLTETDWFVSSKKKSKFGFLIIETEILTSKRKANHSVNRQFQFGFQFNRSNQNIIIWIFINQHGE
jgi:P2-related tail formation protein